MTERVYSDVLVIGAGGAGMTAAVTAAQMGASVCIVSKSRLLRGGATVMAPGAVAAIDDSWKAEGDSVKAHIEDTLCCGENMADPFFVQQTLTEAGRMIRWLEGLGAMFQREADGKKLALRITGGHRFPRSLYIENRVGREICRALWGELQRLEVRIVEEVVITDPLLQDNRICGAQGFAVRDASTVEFIAKSVIIATGGIGYIYALTDNPSDVTGDGLAFALRAGAQLTDMEFVQFYPISFLHPLYARGQVAGFPAYVRLFNAAGERFMERYDSRLELATRDTLSVAIASEVRRGYGSPHGGVYCSLEHCKQGRLEQELPGLFDIYRASKIDPYKDRFEIGPSAHFLQGGVSVDHNRMSRVDGLYAVGEAAAGMHGANRLGQNALTEVLVSGAVAGRNAAERAAQVRGNTPKAQRKKTKSGKIDHVFRQRDIIRNVMQQNVGVVREKERLRRAANFLLECRQDDWKCPGCGKIKKTAYENACMALIGYCVAESARLRTRSLGCHYRLDESTAGADERDVRVVAEWGSGAPVVGLQSRIKDIPK